MSEEGCRNPTELKSWVALPRPINNLKNTGSAVREERQTAQTVLAVHMIRPDIGFKRLFLHFYLLSTSNTGQQESSL